VDKEGFRRFLKREKRSPNAIKRCIKYVEDFEFFLRNYRDGKKLEQTTNQDIKTYVDSIERKSKSSVNTHLWALRYYFRYMSKTEQENLALKLRQERIRRKRFLLEDFVDVDLELIEKLSSIGIRTTDDLIEIGRTSKMRKKLSEKLETPLKSILELVKLSDLARIKGIKGIRARLYHNAGIDTIENMASWDPIDMRKYLVQWVERTGFQGIAPLLKEIQFSIESARNLPKIIEY
jgi:site-specific recombinase XerD